LVPVQIVLRDLALADVESFEDLLQAFFKRPVAAKLRSEQTLLQQYLQAGLGIFLIDGLDEVGVETRKKLRRIILQGFALYPNCFFLCTSRIVGYDEAPLTHKPHFDSIQSLTDGSLPCDKVAEPIAEYIVDKNEFEPAVYYMAPMTNNQIASFALQWYGEQGTPVGAQLLRDTFLKAVWANEGTTRLARIPNLLTMMALIFKIRSQLPNGRALLYEDIAQAYLESIDTARNLKDPIPWQKKKIWLARIGFEMQLRRQAAFNEEQRLPDNQIKEQELLIAHDDILCLIKSAMEDTGDIHDDEYAEKYLDWITRRSGLLIPRGEGLFAFMHLSFQEYFAAVYIQFQIQNPAWLDDEEDEDDLTVDTRVNKTILAEWADTGTWQQSLIFLFELFDGKQGWSNRLWRYCFSTVRDSTMCRNYEPVIESDWRKYIYLALFNHSTPIFNLITNLLSNPHVSIKDKTSKDTINKLIELAWEQQLVLNNLKCIKEDLQFVFPISGRKNKSYMAKLLSMENLREQVLSTPKKFKDLKTLTLKYEDVDPAIIHRLA
jgi:internalin A